MRKSGVHHYLLFLNVFLCLFDAIVELPAMDEKMFNDIPIGKGKWNLYAIRGLFNS